MTNVIGQAARSSGLSFLGSLISAIAGFALSLVLARMLGPSGSGIVFQLISVFTIAGAAAKLGLDTASVWLLPRLAADSPGSIRRAAAILLGGAAAGGVLAGIVLLLIAPLLDDSAEDLERIVAISAAFMPLASVLAVALGITRGLGGVRDYVLIGSVGLPVARLIVVAMASAVMATAVVASIAWLAVLVAAVLLGLIAVRYALKRSPRGEEAETFGALVRRIGAFSAPRTLSSSIEQALLWLDVLMVGVLAGASAAGIYGVVARLVQAGTIPSTSMRIVVAPQFSRMLHHDRASELSEFYTRTTQWIILLSIPIYVVLGVLAVPVLRVFGPEFDSGATALAIMCVGASVSACAGNVQSLLLMSGRSGWAAANKVIVLAVSITLLLMLVPRAGIVGAAIATTTAIALDSVLAVIQVRYGVKVRLGGSAVARAVIVAGLSTAIPAVLARLIWPDSIWSLICGGAAAVVVWAGVLYGVRERFAIDELTATLKRRK